MLAKVTAEKHGKAATGGQGGARDNFQQSQCNNCGRFVSDKPFKICPNCHVVKNCSNACQQAQWKEHEVLCKAIYYLRSLETVSPAKVDSVDNSVYM